MNHKLKLKGALSLHSILWMGVLVLFSQCFSEITGAVLCLEVQQVHMVREGSGKEVVDNTYNQRLFVDTNTYVWRIDDLGKPSFAYSYQDFVLEKLNLGKPAVEYYNLSLPLFKNPIFLDEDKRLSWMVYCAKDYLRSREDQQVALPVGDTGFDFYIQTCRIKTKWRSKTDTCPEEMEFYFDEQLLKSAFDRLNAEPMGSVLDARAKLFERFSKEYHNGDKMGVLHVSDWSNEFGVGIPVSWDLQTYWFGNPGRHIIGKTASVKLSELIEEPAIPKHAKIIDLRLRNEKFGINRITYEITNGIIPSVKDPKVLNRAANSMDLNRLQRPREAGKSKSILVGLIMVLLVVPVVYALFSKKKAISS